MLYLLIALLVESRYIVCPSEELEIRTTVFCLPHAQPRCRGSRWTLSAILVRSWFTGTTETIPHAAYRGEPCFRVWFGETFWLSRERTQIVPDVVHVSRNVPILVYSVRHSYRAYECICASFLVGKAELQAY